MKNIFLLHLIIFCFGINCAYSFDGELKNKYTFRIFGSPHYAPESNSLFQAHDRIVIDFDESYIFSGGSTYELESCRLDMLVMCVLIPSHGFSLYMPRNRSKWTKWTHDNRVYVFDDQKSYPFLPSGAGVVAIHAFDADLLSSRKKTGGLSYPLETYFIDKNERLVGMVRYHLSNPAHPGLNENNIAAFYWSDGEGLPISEF